MKRLSTFFSWVFGVVLALVGISLLFSNAYIAGLLILTAALLLLPPSVDFILEKKPRVTASTRLLAAFLLVVVGSMVSGADEKTIAIVETAAVEADERDVEPANTTTPAENITEENITEKSSAQLTSQESADSTSVSETTTDSVVADTTTRVLDSEGLLAEWFGKHDYLVLIAETLTNRWDGIDLTSPRELSEDCEIALEQDRRENEPNDLFARAGVKVHTYLSSGDSESFEELEPHPNCVAAFDGAPGGPSLCAELRKKMPARVVVDEDGAPVSFTSNWVTWGIDASNFSEDNRVVTLNATVDGERRRQFAYVCGYN